MKKASQYRHVLENTLGIPFTDNNKVEVLCNGDEIFPPMLKAIKNANKKIDLLTFVYWSGSIAREFAEALAAKAEEGLQVRVILDCYGAAFMPDKLSKLMEDSGVNLQWFRPFANWKVWKSDNRTHRKVLICDGHIAFTGGVGIAEEWEGDARNPSEWRETHFKITGPAVPGLQAAFMENWVEADGFLPVDPDWETEQEKQKRSAGSVPVQVIRTSASVRWSDIVMLYQTLIKIAQDSIYITTAYFNPDEHIVELLTDAVERGVEVNIMMPGKHTDQRLARLAGEETFEELLEGNVNLWYYQKTMFHSKAFIVDGMISCIGSANFNHRSMLKDDEINLVCLNEDLAGEIIQNFEDDLEACKKIDRSRWERRSFLQRGIEKVVTLGRDEI